MHAASALIVGVPVLTLIKHANRHLTDGMQLEHLSEAERGNAYVSFPIQLEQHLMVGSYHKVRPSVRPSVFFHCSTALCK